MFDVIWTDHNRELVGERKARKELEKESKRKDDDRSVRDSMSTRGSSSSGDKSFGFFGSMSFKKSSLSSKTKATASSSLRAPSRQESKTERDSLFAAPPSSTASSEEKPSSMVPMDGNYLLERMADSWENSPDRSSKESVFSKWTEPSIQSHGSLCGGSVEDSNTTPTPKTKIVQALGQGSYITETIETITEPRRDTDAGVVISDVTITAETQVQRAPSPPASLRDVSVFHHTQKWMLGLNDHASSPSPTRHDETLSARSPLLPPIIQPRPLTPSNTVRYRSPIVTPPAASAKLIPNNTQLWKAPEEWDSSPTSETEPSPIEDIIQPLMTDENDNPMSLDLAGMQREIMRMAAASPQIVLIRLKEEWGTATDAALYKELEMEKKRWMLSALHNDTIRHHSSDTAHGIEKAMIPKGQKVLALYESQATASYLAARHPGQPIYHLSPSPLSHSLFPNVLPMFTPIVSHSALTFAPQLFSAVHSLSLPSLLPSSEMPQLLRNINRYLADNGVLHLTLIDPSPVSSTLGPHLRSWLSENLLLNLERQFRCMNPSKLFPSWLADAQLRGDGSTITSVKFAAVASATPRGADISNISSDDSFGEYNGEERNMRVELRSITGRMLWKEVWGTFVTGNKWWWEIPECVEECRKLGTKWEYSLIEAVKQARDA